VSHIGNFKFSSSHIEKSKKEQVKLIFKKFLFIFLREKSEQAWGVGAEGERETQTGSTLCSVEPDGRAGSHDLRS